MILKDANLLNAGSDAGSDAVSAGVSLHPGAGGVAAAGGEDAGGPRGVVPAGPALAEEEDQRPAQQHRGHLEGWR